MIGLVQLLNRIKATPTGAGKCRILSLDGHMGPVYAVGDVHGCKSHLLCLISLIRQDAANFPGDPMIVLLGDVIDRGPDSAGVLDYLTNLPQTLPVRAILGNHERMMLSFFAAPRQNLRWLDLGGFETLRSYGLALTLQDAANMSQRRLMQTLAVHVPQSHLDWLAALPHGYRLSVNNEDFLLVHAGYNPTLPDSAQQEDVLIWGRKVAQGLPSNLRRVQGHKIVHTPDPAAQCIQIDTGAWQTGALSALRLVSGCSPKLMCYSPC